jgi:acid phosphatase class B
VCKYNDTVNLWCQDYHYCPHFKDRTKFVELPCKVGDVVYVINKRGKSKKSIISKTVITKIHIDDNTNDTVIFGEIPDEHYRELVFRSHCFGFNAFFDKSKAEQALREREQK